MKYLLLLLSLGLSGCFVEEEPYVRPPKRLKALCNGIEPPLWSIERGSCRCEPMGWLCRGHVRHPLKENHYNGYDF